jgi:hypothetical protein
MLIYRIFNLLSQRIGTFVRERAHRIAALKFDPEIQMPAKKFILYSISASDKNG